MRNQRVVVLAVIKRVVTPRAKILALLSLLGLLLPLLTQSQLMGDGTLAWLLDLAVHWQWLYWTSLLVFGVLSAWGDRRWLWVLLALPLPWLTAAPRANVMTTEQAEFTIMSANVHLDNRDAAPLKQWMLHDKPDVVVLLELSPEYAHQIDALPDYPYRRLEPENSPFGIGVLSRHPFNAVQVKRDEDGIPRIDVVLDWRGRPVRVIAVHPMPPIAVQYHVQRNALLSALTAESGSLGLPTLVVGDLNATPWSSAFKGLGLKRAGDLTGTWPAALGAFGLPLDHVLVSTHWSVAAAHVHGGLGSDHLALIVSLTRVD